MHHTNALILRKSERGEADWLVTALSADFGKIRLLAQGARKHGAKLQGHLEPGSHAELSFVIGRNGYRLTTARLKRFPAGAFDATERIAALSTVLAAADANLLEEREGAAGIFHDAVSAVGAIATADGPEAPRCLAVWFQGRLLRRLGLLPAADAPEAVRLGALLGLASTTIETAVSGGMPVEEAEAELVWFGHHLGGIVRLSVARPGSSPALY